MIDPKMTNIVGQRVAVMRHAEAGSEVAGRGVIRAVDYGVRGFMFLIEAVGAIGSPGIMVLDGGFFELPARNEFLEVVVDRGDGDSEVPSPVLPAPIDSRHVGDDSMKDAPWKVVLNYFKPCGSHYASGEYETRVPVVDLGYPPGVRAPVLYQIFEEVERLASEKRLPGLREGHSDFAVLVDVPNHPHRHLHLIPTSESFESDTVDDDVLAREIQMMETDGFASERWKRCLAWLRELQDRRRSSDRLEAARAMRPSEVDHD